MTRPVTPQRIVATLRQRAALATDEVRPKDARVMNLAADEIEELSAIVDTLIRVAEEHE